MSLLPGQGWDRAGLPRGDPCGGPQRVSGVVWGSGVGLCRCFQFQDSAFILLQLCAGTVCMYSLTVWWRELYLPKAGEKNMFMKRKLLQSLGPKHANFEENFFFCAFSKPQQGVHAKDLLSGWEVDADRFLDSHKSTSRPLQFFCTVLKICLVCGILMWLFLYFQTHAVNSLSNALF